MICNIHTVCRKQQIKDGQLKDQAQLIDRR